MQTRAKTNLPIFKMQRDPPEIYTIRVSPYIEVLPTNLPLPHPNYFGISGRFPFNPKFQKFRLVHQVERAISVGPTGIFGTSFEGSPL